MACTAATLVEVFNPRLDKTKSWYALTESVVEGAGVGKFVKSSFFQYFKNEIVKMNMEDLTIKNGAKIDPRVFCAKYTKKEVYVVSTLGLCGGLLSKNHKNLEKSDFITSEPFHRICCHINSCSATTGLQSVNAEAFALRSDLSQAEAIIRSLQCQIDLLTKSRSSTEAGQVNSEPVGEEPSINTPPKKRKLSSQYGNRNQARKVLRTLDGVCDRHRTSIEQVLGYLCATEPAEQPSRAKDIISEVVDAVVAKKGERKGLEHVLPDATQRYIESFRVPDWVLLYFKLASKMPDNSWQTMLNLTRLGRTGTDSDADILLNKNQVKAVRRMIFDVVKTTLGLSVTPSGMKGRQVHLQDVLIWMIREQRLHGLDKTNIELNIKLDGRPFWGKDQVMVGVVPIESPFLSSQSCKSVWPLAIVNCKETRNNINGLLEHLTGQKMAIEKNGITVDGRSYNVKFTVTADYKALSLCTKKRSSGEDIQLCSKGKAVEFCLYCTAIRGCNCPGVGPHEACMKCFAKSKGNIGSWKGVRDDLLVLMNTEVSDVNLCALHCELRNTEQLLGQLGLCAHECGSMKDCNEILSKYGPETLTKDRIVVKLKPNQDTAVNKYNIKVRSFSGNTERKFLKNAEDIVENALPISKVISLYPDHESAEKAVHSHLSFCEERQLWYSELLQTGHFTRDNGMEKDQEIELDDKDPLGIYVMKKVDFWGKQVEVISNTYSDFSDAETSSAELRDYAAQLLVYRYKEAFTQWRELASIMRDRVFDEDEDQEIDIYDIMCKEWGYLLRDIFGTGLGTGDYGHMTIEHSPMLMRRFRSMARYSNQGFEALHKVHRQLYARCTNHDATSSESSIQQMFLHFYAEKLLFIRLCFREARECILSTGVNRKKAMRKFHFRGCGWKFPKDRPQWCSLERFWILEVNGLFDNIFAEDFLSYFYDKRKVMYVCESNLPKQPYNHAEWETRFKEASIREHSSETLPMPSPLPQPVVLGMPKPEPSTPVETSSAPPLSSVHQPSPVVESNSCQTPISTASSAKCHENQCDTRRNLNFAMSEKEQAVSVTTAVNNAPTYSTVALPRVPAWGGRCIKDGNEIILVNTCNIDNILTLLYLRMKEVPELYQKISKQTNETAQLLIRVVDLFNRGEFTRGKIEWLQQFPSFDFCSSGLVNVWGSEDDMFRKCFSWSLRSEETSACSARECPKKVELSTFCAINLHEVSMLQNGETYLEAALREWLVSEPRPCGKEFSGVVPMNAPAVRGAVRYNVSTGADDQPMLCNGIRSFTEKVFSGLTFALPIALHHFAINGTIVKPIDLPLQLNLNEKEFELFGCTFWNGGHYNACMKFHGQWFSYDGARENQNAGSGLMSVNLNSLPPMGYTLVSCLYFEKHVYET